MENIELSRLNGIKILMVEDEQSIVEMYKLKLEKEGFEIDSVSNGFESLIYIQNNNPDLILLDLMMPQMDGFETLQIIKKQTSLNTKIIVFSNINRKEDIDRAFLLGANDYLVKANVTPKEVVDRIKSMLIKNTPKSDKKECTCPNCNHKFYI